MKTAILFIALTSALSAGDFTNRVEATGFGSVTQFTRDASRTHSNYGGSLGVGINPRTTLFGEASHTSRGGGDFMDYNGGLKYSLITKGRIEPYVLGGIGLASHNNIFFTLPGQSSLDFGVNAGIGTRFYVRDWWGIAPELRWVHYFNNGLDTNLFRYTGGVFFQWNRWVPWRR